MDPQYGSRSRESFYVCNFSLQLFRLFHNFYAMAQKRTEALFNELTNHAAFKLFTYSKYLSIFLIPAVIVLFSIALLSRKLSIVRISGCYLIGLLFFFLELAFNFHHANVTTAVVYAGSKGMSDLSCAPLFEWATSNCYSKATIHEDLLGNLPFEV